MGNGEATLSTPSPPRRSPIILVEKHTNGKQPDRMAEKCVIRDDVMREEGTLPYHESRITHRKS